MLASCNDPRRERVAAGRGMIVNVLSTRRFKHAFLGSLSRQIVRISVVSPYVTTIPGFSSAQDFFRKLAGRMPDASVDLVTKPPDDNSNSVLSWQEADLITRLGVNLKFRRSNLHSKVYYVRYLEGDCSCFIGSANFTKGGFETNEETVAYWRRSKPDPQIEQELARLTGPGAFNLLQWAIETKQKRKLRR